MSFKDTPTKLNLRTILVLSSAISPPLTELRLAQQTVVNLYPSAVSEWGEVIARFDKLGTNEEPSMPSEKAEDDLALWLDDLDMDSGEQESHPEMFGLPVLDIGQIDSLTQEGADIVGSNPLRPAGR